MTTSNKVDLSHSTAELLFEEASRRRLNPRWETDYGLFSFKLNGQRKYLFFSKLPFNSHLSAEFAKNKHFTHIILDGARISTIPYSVPKDLKEASDFLKIYKKIIAKPTLGERSHQVTLISNDVELKNADFSLMILEKYVEGLEIRFLILKKKVIGVIQKNASPLPNRPWHKLNETIDESKWDKELTIFALKIAQILELDWCAVDFIIDEHNKAWVLEVNAAPGIKFFHYPEKGESINIAREIFEELTVSTSLLLY